MAEPAIASSKADQRRALLGIFFVLLVLAGAGATAYYWYHLRFFESTDDAYVAANIIPAAAGTPTAVADGRVIVTNGGRLGETPVTCTVTGTTASLGGNK